MRTFALGIFIILIVSISLPLASSSGLTSTDPPSVHIMPPSGSMGTLVQIDGSGLAKNATFYILFESTIVGFMSANRSGSLNGEFTVPLVNSGDYNVSLEQTDGTFVSKTISFDVTFGLNNLNASIQSIQLNQTNESGQLAPLSNLESQIAQISSMQTEQSALLKNITSMEQQDQNSLQAIKAQQNLTPYLVIVTIAALAAAALSSYWLYRVKRKRFEELEVIQ